jgi:hypothetical protein
VVEAVDAYGGRVVVVAGTNAGGTVQAPALASLVAQLVDGRAGPAHLAMAASRPAVARIAEARLAVAADSLS